MIWLVKTETDLLQIIQTIARLKLRIITLVFSVTESLNAETSCLISKYPTFRTTELEKTTIFFEFFEPPTDSKRSPEQPSIGLPS